MGAKRTNGRVFLYLSIPKKAFNVTVYNAVQKKLSIMEKKARDLHIKDILNILWKQNYALYFSFIFKGKI